MDPTWERRPTSETAPAPTKKLSTILSQTTDSGLEARRFQPMPELTTEQMIDALLDPATAESWRPQWDHGTFLPLAEDERQSLLATISGAQ